MCPRWKIWEKHFRQRKQTKAWSMTTVWFKEELQLGEKEIEQETRELDRCQIIGVNIYAKLKDAGPHLMDNKKPLKDFHWIFMSEWSTIMETWKMDWRGMPEQRDTSQQTITTAHAQRMRAGASLLPVGKEATQDTEVIFSTILLFYLFYQKSGVTKLSPWNIIWANRSQALTMFQTLGRPAYEWSPRRSEPLQLVTRLYLSGLPAHFCSYQKFFDFWESVVLFLSYRFVLPDMLVKII